MKTQFHPQRSSVMQSLPPKIQQFKCSEKHLSKHKELKFKDIPKYQRQAEADFNPKNILVFPMNVQDINGPFRMLWEAEAECPLIEGNENCFGCIRRSKRVNYNKSPWTRPKSWSSSQERSVHPDMSTVPILNQLQQASQNPDSEP